PAPLSLAIASHGARCLPGGAALPVAVGFEGREVEVDATSSRPRVVADAGVVVSGEGRDRTLTITPTGKKGRTTITVTATAGEETATETLTFIVGSGRGEKIVGTAGMDVVLAGGGDDRVNLERGDDVACGGA